MERRERERERERGGGVFVCVWGGERGWKLEKILISSRLVLHHSAPTIFRSAFL